MVTFETVDDYIASFPPDVQPVLETVRRAIHDALPGTDEGISHGIPGFRMDGRYVVYFAGWKRHVSVYPIPSGDAALTAELEPHVAAKGTLRFPLAKPMPLALIGMVAAELLRQRQAGQR